MHGHGGRMRGTAVRLLHFISTVHGRRCALLESRSGQSGAGRQGALGELEIGPGVVPPTDADLERRFGGLRRLYGEAGYQHIRAARVAVVGVGGVGSWAAEALARSGVAELVLIDMDHVAESNINRQVQALGATAGMAKV